MARARSMSRLESFVLDQIAEAGSEEVTTLPDAVYDRRARETALAPPSRARISRPDETCAADPR
ncbi:MAG: hypothetical protein K8W52_38775 [Deltaproteobacteria bacterium]|nr:hypothetical protein [Deltaproteobacteria bacterium]